MNLKPGDRVVLLRDIYRFDGPATIKSQNPWSTQLGRERILYAQAGDAGSVLETFRSDNGYWYAKVDMNGKCLTFRLTSLRNAAVHSTPPRGRSSAKANDGRATRWRINLNRTSTSPT